MSSTSPISVRIASKTRFFETTGASSYYYSSQLLSNMALLKAVTRLGQQLGWPSKALGPKTTQGSTFLAKASQSVVNSRMEPLINLQATPGKEWISANLKLVTKLTTSQQFFNSKAVGFLAKGLGRSGKFDSVIFPRGSVQHLPPDSAKSDLILNPLSVQCELREPSWFTCFNYLAQLSKYCNFKYYKFQILNRYSSFSSQTIPTRPALHSNAKFSPTKNRKAFTNNALKGSTGKICSLSFADCAEARRFSNQKTSYKVQSFSQKTSITNLRTTESRLRALRKESRQAFKTPTGLSFYLTALGLVGHSQVLRSSLVIAPIVSDITIRWKRSALYRSQTAVTDHKKVIKIASSNGIGLVSASPKGFISRSTKDTVLNFFYKIPAKLAEKKLNNRPQYQQVYILADLQLEYLSQKRLKPTYASARWL